MDREAIIQVDEGESNAFEASLKNVSIRYAQTGKSRNFHGHAVVDVLIKYAPVAVPVLKGVLEAWLQKRKRFRVTVGGVVVEANSVEDLDRAVDALSRKI